MGPDKKLLLAMMLTMLVRRPNDVGIGPENKFSLINSSTRLRNWPSELGNEPKKKLPTRSKVTKDDILPMGDGTRPDIWL